MIEIYGKFMYFNTISRRRVEIKRTYAVRVASDQLVTAWP